MASRLKWGVIYRKVSTFHEPIIELGVTQLAIRGHCLYTNHMVVRFSGIC